MVFRDYVPGGYRDEQISQLTFCRGKFKDLKHCLRNSFVAIFTLFSLKKKKSVRIAYSGLNSEGTDLKGHYFHS